MLIPVGNMNDRSPESLSDQVVPNRGTGIQHPPSSHWRRDEAGVGEREEEKESVGAVSPKGLVFTLLNIRKTKFKDRCRESCYVHPVGLGLFFPLRVCAVFTGGWLTRPSRNCQLQAHQVQVLQKPACPPAKSALPTLSSILSQEQ